MDGLYIPLPLQLLAGGLLMGGLLGVWRARGGGAKGLLFAAMLMFFGIAAVGLTMMLAGG